MLEVNSCHFGGGRRAVTEQGAQRDFWAVRNSQFWVWLDKCVHSVKI